MAFATFAGSLFDAEKTRVFLSDLLLDLLLQGIDKFVELCLVFVEVIECVFCNSSFCSFVSRRCCIKTWKDVCSSWFGVVVAIGRLSDGFVL